MAQSSAGEQKDVKDLVEEILKSFSTSTVAGYLEIHNPATGEVVGKAPMHTVADLESAIADAKAAQPAWAALGHEKRSKILNQAADAIDANAESLALLLSQEQGKPLNGPNARFEIGGASAWLRAAAATSLEEQVVIDDESGKATLTYRPIGVVGAIGPWNWPVMITVWQIAPALRMGNAVVVKPSEYTPLSVLALIHVLNTVLPHGVLRGVSGDRDLGAHVSSHPEVGKVMFTGSTKTGKDIIRNSADTVKRLTLELGGNDAGIVLPDVNPDEIAESIFWGAFINTGQTCAALKRLYVHEDVYEDVVQAVAEVAKKMPMGIGTDENNVLGPLQNKAQFEIVERLVESAKSDGARIVIGGNPDPEQPGYFYPTTIVADIPNENPLVQEEQFGPALPIVKYSNLEDAISMANGLEVGLGASVWSSDTSKAREIADQIEAGTVWINSHGGVHPMVPFGGSKQSGYGLEFGVEGLKALGQPQIIYG